MKHMKKERKTFLRNIAIMVAIALVIGTVSVSGGVSDNLGSSMDKILGPVNASLNGTFQKSSTNGKLNQLKKDMDTTKSTVSNLLSPYLSSLTVWVDSTNAAYSGKTVSVTNSKGETKTAAFAFRNGHYEATFPKLVRNNYDISYPFILSNGKTIVPAIQMNLVAGNNSKQLFGDLQMMSISDIQAACKAGSISSLAKVGDTISDGTYTYTIIGINQDSPCDENGTLLNKSAYGDVLTLMALGAPAGNGDGKTPVQADGTKTPLGTAEYKMSIYNTACGWKGSLVRTETMPKYLALLPKSTQNAIGYVQKATGTNYTYSYSASGGEVERTADKCFLLSVKEICGDRPLSGGGRYGNTDNERANNFCYQYFDTISTSWITSLSMNSWTRSPSVSQSNYYAQYFCLVGGSVACPGSTANSIYPAFCIY